MIAAAHRNDAYLGTQPTTERQPLRHAPVAKQARGLIRAKYDAASDSVEFANYWANTDSYDSDSANSKAVRVKLVKRSRYEVANNGYADGIAQTHANFTIGLGPSLQMRTGSAALDSRIEAAFYEWAKAVQLRRKLWCAAHAKLVDGEAFALLVINESVAHRVKLDLVPIECEQVTTPYLPYREVGMIDGIVFDRFGNPIWYDVLPQHPGGLWSYAYQTPDQVAARYVGHWFALRRPGQHRGIPECTSTLQVGASSRRWREATVSAAETAASFAALLQTDMPPGDADQVRPFETMEIERRMMAALPMGWKSEQMVAQHPNATYDSFNQAQIAESARPKNMPYNMAACDSSKSNYASGRLDFQPYFAGVDIERADCEDTILEKLFVQWWKEAALAYGFGDAREVPSHAWDWPNHPVADLNAEATSIDTKLKNGTAVLRQVYADAGDDYGDAIKQMAEDYGVTEPEMRELIRLSIFNATNQIGSIAQADVQRQNAQTQAATQVAVSGKQDQQSTAEPSIAACDCRDVHAAECVKWITYGTGKGEDGERTGGRKMCLDSAGNISKGGPKSLSGKPISKMREHFKKMKNNPAAHRAKFEKDAESNSKELGIDKAEYKKIADDLWREDMSRHGERESAKEYARKLTGMTQADITRIENKGGDYAQNDPKLRRFDEYASAVAQQFSGLGINPDDAEADVWDLLREGRVDPPAKNSDEYHRRVVDYVNRNSSTSGSDYIDLQEQMADVEFSAKRQRGDINAEGKE